MAYNPFNIFRRNQKALFAVLTVFIMIMFTLSFGAGDFFERVPRWLNARSGDVVCKLDGDKITTGDLEGGPHSVSFRRVMANRFMALAADQSVRTLEASITEQMPRLNEDGRRLAQGALTILGEVRMGRLTLEDVRELPRVADGLIPQIESPNTRSEHKQVARDAHAMLMLLYKIGMGGNSHYFLNAPNQTRRHLIEFMIWEKKADQMGIRFTRDDVNRMIQSEFNNAFRSDVEVRKIMQQSQGFTMDGCLDALASEFKVRAAQTALLGRTSRIGEAAVYPTPFEVFDYYREQCSPATYEVIPVPAAGFVDSVIGEPTDEQLKELFRNGENLEPDPKSQTPGFKDPRKISVAWIGITGTEPYYLKLAEEQVKVGEVMARASGLLSVPLPGATATWAAGAVAPMSVQEPAVNAAYNGYSDRFKFQLRNEYSSPEMLTRDILPSSVIRPGVLASTLGGFVGQAAGFGNPASAASVAMGAPIAYEIRDRVKVGMPLVMGLTPGPGMLPTLVGGTAAGAFHEPKPLPIGYMRPELIKTAIEERAKIIAFGQRGNPMDPMAGTREKGDLNRFIEELGKLTEDGKPKDKTAVEKHIQDFIASRGLPPTQVGRSAASRDEWTLEDDPGLQPLVVAQKASLRQASPFHGSEYIPFGQSFFWTRERDPTSLLRTRRGPATSGLYQAQPYPPMAGEPREGEMRYVVWRTEDIQPKKTLNLETARTSGVLKAAWKRMEARKLAEAHANRVAEEIRAHPRTDEFAISQFLADKAFELQRGINDPKARQRARLFPVNNVAPLVPGFSPRFRQELQPFEQRESENIPYPTPEMRTVLLDNRDKPPKTVVVMADAPRDTFYVATLIKRELKSMDEFRTNVFSQFGNAQDIRGRYYAEAMNKTRQSVLDLLKQEFKYEETEEQKKKLDENVKSGGRD